MKEIKKEFKQISMSPKVWCTVCKKFFNNIENHYKQEHPKELKSKTMDFLKKLKK